MNEVSKTLQALAAVHAAKLLEHLLGACYQVDSVEFVAKVTHSEVATGSDYEANELRQYTTMLTHAEGETEVLTAPIRGEAYETT